MRTAKARATVLPQPDDEEIAFYRRVIEKLQEAKVPFLIGGTHMMEHYTGLVRDTKDLDLHVKRQDVERAREVMSAAGYRTELTFPHWLAKISQGKYFVDVIFSSGNGICEVDDVWFRYATAGEVWRLPVRFTPPEESVWSKAFIMERERYDGADVAHLLHACAARMDWLRLLWRFDRHWRVLLSHLLLFGFIYPTKRALVPQWMLQELWSRVQKEVKNSVRDREDDICRGTLLSREQFLPDLEFWRYTDARLFPDVRMTGDDIARWTAAAREKK